MTLKNTPTKQDFTLLHRLTDGFFTPAALPISFRYGEKLLRGIPWSAKSEWQRPDANITRSVITAADPETKLEIRAVCETYNDFPVLEWTVYLTNTGSENTPVIRDLMGMDAALDIGSPILQYGSGDHNGEKSYEFYERPLTEEPFEMQPINGMACDCAFPYMRILSPEEKMGIVLSIGWPGQWMAQLFHAEGKTVIRAGQAETAFYLKPGETVRTPRMTVMAFTGEKSRAVNLWRRWYMAHVIPKNNGSATKPMLIVSAPHASNGPECTSYTQDSIRCALDSYQRHGIRYDLFWLDAGWYADCGSDWKIVGSWEPRQPNYPEGMLGVQKLCKTHGADFLLWFDPERVHDGTKIAKEHPEWLLDAPQELLNEPWFIGSHLFNIGDPNAWRYITDLICDFVRDNKLDWYRQDYNIWPLHFWRTNDGENRHGITENLCIQGYLAFWDELLRRNPGLQIDCCAGGGRRNDLESMRRSVPLHHSDLAYGDLPVKMGFQQTMAEWLPYHRSPLLNWECPDGIYRQTADSLKSRIPDAYTICCALAPAISVSAYYDQDDEVFATLREMQDTWRKAADIMLRSDFYSLTPYHKDSAGWWCRQFDCPEQKDGFLLFVTGSRCTRKTQTVTPCLDENAVYLFVNERTGETRTMTGKAAMEGFCETLPARSGSIWFYTQK